jgi:hypothetical protein
MKQPDPQPTMPRERLGVFIVLFFIGAGLLVWLIFNRSIDQGTTTSAIVGVITSCFIVSGVELMPEFVRWMTAISRRGKFRKFFGGMALRDDVRLVFAYRTLEENCNNNNPFKTYSDYHLQSQPSGSGEAPSSSETKASLAEGINGWLAFQDVQAAVYVTNMFSKMTGRQVRAVHDKSLEGDDKDYCIVSFGLGFNAFTHITANYFAPRIFQIEFGRSPKLPDKYPSTDNFKINGSEVEIPDRFDIAIVARIVPPGQAEDSERIWFLCAGRTAAGTAAAGYFLAKKWRQIFELYKTEKKDFSRDSVVVVIQHLEFSAGKTGGSVDHTAAFLHGPDGKPVVQWGVAAGVHDAGYPHRGCWGTT